MVARIDTLENENKQLKALFEDVTGDQGKGERMKYYVDAWHVIRRRYEVEAGSPGEALNSVRRWREDSPEDSPSVDLRDDNPEYIHNYKSDEWEVTEIE